MVVHFIQRVVNYPVVTSAYGQATDYYNWAKEQNTYVKSAAVFTEGSVLKVAGSAQPLLKKFDQRIQSLDELACMQLDRLEKSYPVVTEPTEQVLDKTATYYKQSLKPKVDLVVHPVTTAVETANFVKNYGQMKITDIRCQTVATARRAKDYGLTKYREMIYSRYGQTGLQKLDELLRYVDETVDKMLPPKEDKEKDGETEEEEKSEEQVEEKGKEKKPEQTVRRAIHISGKLRRRLYTRAVHQMLRLKASSDEVVVKPLEDVRHRLEKVKEEFWVRVEKQEEEEHCGQEMSIPHVYFHRLRVFSSAGVEITLENLPESVLRLPTIVRVKTKNGYKEIRSTLDNLLEVVTRNVFFHSMLEYLHIRSENDAESIEMDSMSDKSQPQSADAETTTESRDTVDNSASSDDTEN